MKKFVYLMIFIFAFALHPSKIAFAETKVNIDAEAYVLMDATTGQLIDSKNPDESLEPASTTKVMTALITLENSDLNDKITISKNATMVEGTRLGLVEGEVYTVNDLLHSMLLLSSNDCAVALAEHVAGSTEKFVEMMNKEAKRIGANNTTFSNPAGLSDGTNRTTAHDLALITREAGKNENYIKISKPEAYQFPASNIDGQQKWSDNKNSLIRKNNPYYYSNAIAGKCGYTTSSKHTYTALAEKDGRRLIATILRTDNKDIYFKGAKELFEYGFNTSSLVKLYSKGQEVTSFTGDDSSKIPLLATKDVYYVANKEQETSTHPTVTTNTDNLTKKPFKNGDVVTTSKVNVGDNNYIDIPLASGRDNNVKPAPATLLESLKKHIGLISTGIIAIILILIISIFTSRKKRNSFNSRYY